MITVFYNNKEHLLPEFTTRIKYELLSRENDLPSLVDQNIKRWYKNGKQHRDNDLPAYVNEENGTVSWRQDGLRHRENDKPARMWGNGACEWYKNGLCHRDGNKPAYIGKDGIGWFKNNNYYNNFKLQNLVFLQMFFKLLFHFKYNKIIWSPNDLGGKFTKYQLFLLFK